MRARIYQPSRAATQSGQAKAQGWVLEFSPERRREIDPLMGWTSSDDMNSQVRLQFDSREAAESYAREHGIEAVVLKPSKRKHKIRPGGYGENFSTNRRLGWTH